MKVVVGLGNPGSEYANTRHNAGVLLIDYLGSRGQVLGSSYGWRKFYGIMVYKTKDIVLVKSADYFMNESGNVIRDLAKIYNLEPKTLYIAHDDLDLQLGEFKIQFGKGPKLHNGIEAIENALGTVDFWRVRIGVDARIPEGRIPGEQYVLQNFSLEERRVLDKVLEDIADAIIKTTDSK